MANNPNSSSSSSKMRTDIDLDVVQSIGSHCDLQTCHRLDFLPFKCESCGGYVSPPPLCPRPPSFPP